MTVTVSQAGSTANGLVLTVKVVTGQAVSPIGANAKSLSANDVSVTPAGTGSWVYGAIADVSVGSLTAASGTTLSENFNDVTNGETLGTCRTTGTTTSGTPVTVGASTAGSGSGAVAVLEIKASGTLAEDASSPAIVTTSAATTATTAAFTPPAGSLVVVMAASNVGFSGSTTLSISNTGGLTFTQQVVEGGAGANLVVSIWTAPGPASGPSVALPAAALALAAPAGTPQIGTTVALPAAALALAAPAGHPTVPGTVALPAAALALAAPAGTPQVFVPFPRAALSWGVELLLNGTWTDISSYILYDRAPLSITRGRPDEANFTSPGSCQFVVDNADGRFSPLKPDSPLYGEIGRNTQLRVWMQPSNPNPTGARQYRFWGEISNWSPVWALTDLDRVVQIQAAGVLRRLGQSGSLGTSPQNLPLPLTAYLAGLAGSSVAPVAWWPCTDAAGSVTFASGVAGGPAMTWTGTPGLASVTPFPGSAAIATFAKGTWTGLLSGASATPGGASTVTDSFFASGTWTAPPGVTVLSQVVVVAGGGSASSGKGGGTPDHGTGGGGGGVCVRSGVPVTPGTVYSFTVGVGGGPPAPSGGAGSDGTDSTFTGDSGGITAGAGHGGSGSASPGSGGTGDFPGGMGAVGLGTFIGGGGGGAGGTAGFDAGGGTGENGGGNGGDGGSNGQPGNGGQAPGGGGGGGGSSSTQTGGPGAGGMISLTYEKPGGSSFSASGGPQNANVIRFALKVPSGGDVDGAPVCLTFTSGSVAQAYVDYHAGAAILSSALGAGTITSIAVNPTPFDIPNATTITVHGTGGSQQFTTSGNTPAGSTSITISSASPTITTATGDKVTLNADAPGYLAIRLLSAGGSSVAASGLVAPGTDNADQLVSIELVQSGTSVTWALKTLLLGATSAATQASGTLASSTVGSVGGWVGNPDAELDGTACGQVVIQYATSDLAVLASPADGWEGETAGNRFLRLCAQEGVTSQVTGDPDASVPMGIQASDTFTNLLQACELADRGQVFEPRTFLGLGYICRTAMLAQTAQASLSYAGFDLPDDPFVQPVYDDEFTANDITVTRTGGGSYEAVLSSGRLSVQAPPAGVGPYSAAVALNLATDLQLPALAGWLRSLGTVDDYRWPVISVKMEYETIAATALWGAVSGVDIGAQVEVTSPPSWLTPDDIEQIVFGLTEKITYKSWTISWNCVPASPYLVAVADGGISARAASTGSTLASPATSGATTLSVATTAAGSALWDTASGDWPFDIVIDGERITVTAVSGSSSPQSFTVTRSVNGVVKSHSSGAAVALFFPPIASI